jgi:hypothetical protein
MRCLDPTRRVASASIIGDHLDLAAVIGALVRARSLRALCAPLFLVFWLLFLLRQTIE